MRHAGRHLPEDGKLAGLYRCADGYVRIHTNFAHHRDAVLRLLGLPEGDGSDPADVRAALQRRDPAELATLQRIAASWFLDQRDESARAHAASQADLVSAVRLPQGAFMRLASSVCEV